MAYNVEIWPSGGGRLINPMLPLTLKQNQRWDQTQRNMIMYI